MPLFRSQHPHRNDKKKGSGTTPLPRRNNTTKQQSQERMDPYKTLGLLFPATDAAISKAYKKLALKWHPDKQQAQSQSQSPQPSHAEAEAEQIADAAQRFHDIQEARSFLLDPEHSMARQQYDAQRESERIRKEANALREQSMSERRKKLRNELLAKEKIAAAAAAAVASSTRNNREGTSKRQSSWQGNYQQEEEEEEGGQRLFMEELRREGKRKRTELAEREAMAKQQQQRELQETLLKKRRKENKEGIRYDHEENNSVAIQSKQVRLKWDRKKVILPSPVEESLIKLLSEHQQQFGTIENVEILGKKGNQALVTFQQSSSCQLCVDFYASSKEMRAKYVGKQKEAEVAAAAAEQYLDNMNKKQITRNKDETLQDRKRRQAEERERLLWNMEKEEDETRVTSSGYGGGGSGVRESQRSNQSLSTKTNAARTSHASNSKFPLTFPDQDDIHNNSNNNQNGINLLSPLQILEQFEDVVLKGIISEEELEFIKVVSVPKATKVMKE